MLQCLKCFNKGFGLSKSHLFREPALIGQMVQSIVEKFMTDSF